MKENLFVIGSEHDKKQEDSECDPSDMVSHTDVHYSWWCKMMWWWMCAAYPNGNMHGIAWHNGYLQVLSNRLEHAPLGLRETQQHSQTTRPQDAPSTWFFHHLPAESCWIYMLYRSTFLFLGGLGVGPIHLVLGKVYCSSSTLMYIPVIGNDMGANSCWPPAMYWGVGGNSVDQWYTRTLQV